MTQPRLKNNQIKSKKSSRGGFRPGSGRPPGKSNKRVSWADVIEEFELQTGSAFHEVLVSNYMQARARQDWTLVCQYDRAIFNKLAPDLHQVEIIDRVAEAEQAFEQALKAIAK